MRLRLYIHSNGDNSPLCKVRSRLCGQDTDDKISAYKSCNAMTRYRLIKVATPFPVCLLYGTITISFLIVTRKNTIFSIYNRSNQITFLVGICHSLFIYHRPCFRRLPLHPTLPVLPHRLQYNTHLYKRLNRKKTFLETHRNLR